MTREDLADFAFRAGELHSQSQMLRRTRDRAGVDQAARDLVVEGWLRQWAAMHDEAAGDLVAIDLLSAAAMPEYSRHGEHAARQAFALALHESRLAGWTAEGERLQ